MVINSIPVEKSNIVGVVVPATGVSLVGKPPTPSGRLSPIVKVNDLLPASEEKLTE